MAYVLSEELQRRKFLNERYNYFRSLFGIMDNQVPRFLHPTSDWDLSLQESVVELQEIGDGVPPYDLDSTCIEELDKSKRSFFPSPAQRTPKRGTVRPGGTVVGDQEPTASLHEDLFFQPWTEKAQDERNEATFDSAFHFKDATFQDRKKSSLSSDSLRDELNLIFKRMTEAKKSDKETHLSSDKTTSPSTPLAHSTPCSSMYTPSGREALCESEWTALIYNEFRVRLLDVSMNEIIKCEFDGSLIDNDLMDFVRRIFDHPESSSSHIKSKEVTNRGICYVLIEMRMVGLDIKKHLTMWHDMWQAKTNFVKAFTESMCLLPHSELRNKLLNVSFQFNESHRVLLNCVLMLYHWESTRHFSLPDDDLNPKELLQKKGEKEFARLKSTAPQSPECDSDHSESNCNFSDKLNFSNEDVLKRMPEIPKKEAFFDELEWQAILFDELKIRVRNELSFLVAGKKSLYDEEDGLQVKNSPDFEDVVHEVFPETALNHENLSYFAKIFSGLSKFTQFDFSRHLLQWHSVYKSQTNALKRYGRETVSYAWLIGELNFLNYLPNHPLRIMIDCLLMLSIDGVDIISKSKYFS